MEKRFEGSLYGQSMIICWGLYIHQIWVLKQNGYCESPYSKLWLNNIYNFESYPLFSSVEVKMSSQRLPYVVSRHQQDLCQQFQNAIYSCGDFSCISLWQSWFYHNSQHPSSHQVKGHSFITWLLAVLHSNISNQRSHPATHWYQRSSSFTGAQISRISDKLSRHQQTAVVVL